jgi:hypothetical protein
VGRPVAFGASTKASYAGTSSGGVLTVTDGTNTAQIHMAGDYLNSNFAIRSDGHGGTTVSDPAAKAAAHMVAAMAQMAAPPAMSRRHDGAPSGCQPDAGRARRPRLISTPPLPVRHVAASMSPRRRSLGDESDCPRPDSTLKP